jgi:hypothetical protein
MTIPIGEKVTLPKKQLFYKFFLLCVLLVSYFIYLSIQYDFMTGGFASLLTWTFFVLCTPIADAGMLLDFPLRLLFGVRMLISEIAVWALAISINIISLIYFVEYYETTKLTTLLHLVLTNPYPYWSLVILSAVGTFLSIRFADELMDVIHHRDRGFFHNNSYIHEIIIIVFFISIFIGYYELLASLDIDVEP